MLRSLYLIQNYNLWTKKNYIIKYWPRFGEGGQESYFSFIIGI